MIDNQNIKACITIMLAVNFAISSANAQQDIIDVQKTEQKIASQPDEMPVGSELKLCDDCPIFVKVPQASDDLRNIQYVSKYELTWNNYLAAVDEGVCGFTAPPYIKIEPIKRQDTDRSSNSPPPFPVAARPTKKRPPPITREERIRNNIGKFRVDWPITYLHPLDMKCFVDWFQNKTKLQIKVPTEKEWEWFASAGDPDNKYPWGNQIDTNREALDATKVPYELTTPATMTSQFDSKLRRMIWGVKVGSFTPNAWGIHDLMGNVVELTDDSISYEGDASLSHCINFVTKGDSYGKTNLSTRADVPRYPEHWKEHGIRYKLYVLGCGHGYAYPVGHRLILVVNGEAQ